MAEVRLLTGTSRSGRAETIDGLLLERWNRAFLIVPTRSFARVRLLEILRHGGLPGVVGRPVLTFQEFAALLLGDEPGRATSLSSLEQRILLDRAIEHVRSSGGLGPIGDAGATEGFGNHMERVIAQLKQAAIEPEEFNTCVRKRAMPNRLDAIVARIYEAYQEALQNAGVLDLQGMYWVACLKCLDTKPAALAETDRILLDGFDDFTPSEFRLLESLGPHVSEIVFGLNHRVAPSQKDLYALTTETSQKIQNAFRPVVEALPEKAPATAREYVSDSLFWRDKPRRPAGLGDDLRLLECHSPAHEMETIARRIKRLVRDEGVKASEIAVVARSMSAVAALAREVFDECGIPVNVRHDQTLDDSALGRFLLQLFDALEGWEHGAIVDVLTSVWFNPPGDGDGEYRDRVPLLARMSGVVAREGDWAYRIERLMKRMEEDSGEEMRRFLRHVPEAKAACGHFLASVQALRGLNRDLGKRSTVRDFAEALDRVVDALGVPKTVESLGETEASALRALRGVLGTLWEWHVGDDEAISRGNFRLLLGRAFRLASLDGDPDPSGVSVLDLESARHLRFEYVFFAGVTEGEMPSPPPSNAIYSERDLDVLGKLGVRLDKASGHTRKEQLLFHRIFGVARKELTLSWHRILRNGQETRPGIYLQDVRELLPELKPDEPMSEVQIVAPPPAEVASIRDARNAAFCRSNGVQGTEHLDFRRARIGAEIERVRFDTSPPGVYDGRISSEAMLSRIHAKYDAEHEYSVSALEMYASCPFRFFSERILEILHVDVPDETLDPKVRGLLLHDALQTFHSHYASRPVVEIPADEASETMRSAAIETFEKNAWRSPGLSAGVAHVEEQRLIATLGRYLHNERARDESEWKPAHLEVGFGTAPGKGDGDLAWPEAFVFAAKAGPVRFSGRIDRIDVSDAGVRLIDYKSSNSIEQKDIKAGLSFQLTIYALAAEHHLPEGQTCQEAFYLPVGRDNRRIAISRENSRYPWDERVKIARGAVSRCVAGIREGRFHPTQDVNPCRYCPAENVCRYERERMKRKAAQ